MSYLSWGKKQINDFSNENINSQYNSGFVFGRIGKGVMTQTRSVRINLNKFKLNSENRRILRKTEEIKLNIVDIPYSNYHWSIGKMAKDFYDTKFGKKTFSVFKIKEAIADIKKSNFNKLFIYLANKETIGYCICLETNKIIHYSYPFYDLNYSNKNMGMGMMVRAIEYAKESGKKYIYLGSAQRPSDTYKMQFEGLEWFDGKNWTDDLKKLKEILKNIS